MTYGSPWRGIGAMVVSIATFLTCDTFMKLAMADVPPLEVLVFRGGFATSLCLPLLLGLGLGRHLLLALNGWVLLRALSEAMAVIFFVIVLARVPIGDITAIMQTTPLVIVMGAALIWREPIGPLRVLLIGLGFLGALMVAQPGAGAVSLLALLAFPAALFAAGRDLLSRKVPANVPALVAVLTTLVMVMVCAFIANALFGRWVAPAPQRLAQLAGAGLFLVSGQLFVFLAYRLAPAAIVAPFSYTAALWGVLSGALVFGDLPNALGFSGMALIVASGVAVVILGGRQRGGVAAAGAV